MKQCPTSLGTSVPTFRTRDWSRPMGFYPSLQGLPYPQVCFICLYVSHLSPRRGSWRPGFESPNQVQLPLLWPPASVLAPNLGPTYWRGGVATCAEGIQNAHVSKGQKLTHPSAHVEKHAGQETSLHYTH